jgi:hypothetical protein
MPDHPMDPALDDYYDKLGDLVEGRTPKCGKYLGDNDGTYLQLTCIRDFGHDGPCDNVQGDPER